MNIHYKPTLIGGIIGLLVGIISHYILPYLIFLGVFGSWLNFDNTDSLYYIYLTLDYPVAATIVFVILGAGIGFIVGKNKITRK